MNYIKQFIGIAQIILFVLAFITAMLAYNYGAAPFFATLSGVFLTYLVQSIKAKYESYKEKSDKLNRILIVIEYLKHIFNAIIPARLDAQDYSKIHFDETLNFNARDMVNLISFQICDISQIKVLSEWQSNYRAILEEINGRKEKNHTMAELKKKNLELDQRMNSLLEDNIIKYIETTIKKQLT